MRVDDLGRISTGLEPSDAAELPGALSGFGRGGPARFFCRGVEIGKRCMTSAFAEYDFIRLSNPVDMIEQIASLQDWPFERASEDELTLCVCGKWCDYHVSLNWRDDLESLHLASAFDLRVPQNRQAEMHRLLVQINEQLWLGHFDLWSSEGLLLYRQSLMLNGAEPTPKQCEALLRTAFETCERYYQAFQFVVWAGQRAEDALASVIFDTEGEA